MQISYNATRVKIWNLFLFAKNFIAKNFEVKKIRRKKNLKLKKIALARPGSKCSESLFLRTWPVVFPLQRFVLSQKSAMEDQLK